MSNKNLKPVGRCIYCRSTSNLTREHIIPYALQGDWVLPKASCELCAKITGQLEQRILRGPLLPVRAAANFKTRRPEERPSSFRMKIRRRGREEVHDVPVQEHLTVLILPLLPPAAYMDERPFTSGIDIIGTETIVFGKGPAKLMNTPGVESISVTETYSCVDWMRMIGKIGYALAVAEYGLSAIAKPYVLPAIMGRTDDIGKWVGSDNFVSEAEKQGAVHTCITGIVRHNGEELIVVKVKLFADAHPTGYHVIVGQAK